MFTIDEEHRFTWPCKVNVPVNGGKFEPQTIEVTFRAVDLDRTTELLGKNGADDRALMREAIVELPVADKHGKPMPFSKELLEKVLRIPYVLVALRVGYFEAVNGAGRKN